MKLLNLTWILSIFLICLISPASFGQSSLKEDCSQDCLESNPDRLLSSLTECETCAENYVESGDTLLAASIYQKIGKGLFQRGSLDSALTYMKLSAVLYHQIGDAWNEAGIHSSISQILLTNSEFELALEELQEAIDLVEQPTYSDSTHPYYSHLGELMYTIQEYEQAIIYFKRGMDLYARFDENFFYKATAYSLATTYMDLEEYDKADSVIRVAVAFQPEPEYALQSFIMEKRTEARYYYYTDQEEISVEAYNALLPIADTLGDFGLYVEVNIGLANDYLYLDEPGKADEAFNRVLRKGRLEKNSYFLEDVLKSYAYFLSETGNYEKSAFVLEQVIRHKDSLLAVERMHDIRALHLVDLEQDNFNLTDDNTAKGELIEYYEEYQNLLRIIIIFGTLFILILGVFAFYLWRTGKRLAESRAQLAVQNEKLAEVDRQRIELMKIVGHDLRGPIWSLRNFIEMMNEGDVSEADQKKIQRFALQSVMETQYMLDELTDWAQASGGRLVNESEEIDLRASVDIITGAYQLHAEAKKVKLINEVDEGLTVVSDQRALSTVIRNLIENSIKHTDSGSVAISASQRDHFVEISITDTGAGMSPEILQAVRNGLGVDGSTGTEGEIGKGIGMQSVRLLCEQIGVKLTVDSELGVGTVVRLEMGGEK